LTAEPGALLSASLLQGRQAGKEEEDATPPRRGGRYPILIRVRREGGRQEMPAEHEGGGGGGGGGAAREPDQTTPSSLGGRKRMKMWGPPALPSFLAMLGWSGPGRHGLSLEPNIPSHHHLERIFHLLII